MTSLTTSRIITLLDGRAESRPFVDATLYRGAPAAWLDGIESEWSQARSNAARGGILEHSHWDWRNKLHGVQSGLYKLIVVAVEIEAQGVMAVRELPRPAALGSKGVVYVDYLEAAPWNLKGIVDPPRLIGVGTALLAEAIRISWESGLGGGIGLHSLQQAESFYTRCGMTRVGSDPGYYDLPYFEYAGPRAIEWLQAIGESL